MPSEFQALHLKILQQKLLPDRCLLNLVWSPVNEQALKKDKDIYNVIKMRKLTNPKQHPVSLPLTQGKQDLFLEINQTLCNSKFQLKSRLLIEIVPIQTLMPDTTKILRSTCMIVVMHLSQSRISMCRPLLHQGLS